MKGFIMRGRVFLGLVIVAAFAFALSIFLTGFDRVIAEAINK